MLNVCNNILIIGYIMTSGARGALQVESAGKTVYSPLLDKSQSKCWCCNGKVRTAAKVAAGFTVGLGAGIPLIVEGSKMLQLHNLDGWTAWWDAFYYNDVLQCIPHLGPAAFEKPTGLNSILQGAKYVAIPVGFLAGKYVMKGRWGSRLMNTCAFLGIALDIAGLYGTHFAVKNGVKDAWDGTWNGSNPLNESFIQSSGPVTDASGAQNCAVQLSNPAYMLFASVAVQAAGNLLLGLAAGLYAGRKQSSDAVNAAAASQKPQSAVGPRSERQGADHVEALEDSSAIV